MERETSRLYLAGRYLSHLLSSSGSSECQGAHGWYELSWYWPASQSPVFHRNLMTHSLCSSRFLLVSLNQWRSLDSILTWSTSSPWPCMTSTDSWSVKVSVNRPNLSWLPIRSHSYSFDAFFPKFVRAHLECRSIFSLFSFRSPSRSNSSPWRRKSFILYGRTSCGHRVKSKAPSEIYPRRIHWSPTSNDRVAFAVWIDIFHSSL